MARDYDNIADAISAVNGEVSDQSTKIADILEALEGKAGGGLPSVISKIDSGSFTLLTDTAGSSYTIQHNLGVVPKEFSIWTEENDAYAPYANQTLISTFARVKQINDSATVVSGGWYSHLNRRTNGDLTTFANIVRANEASNLATANYIKWNSTNKYKAGCTYKWIAWV